VRERTDELLEALKLDEWRKTLGTRLSGGVRRLAGFVMSAVWPGWLLILDEPTNDVDPLRRRLLWKQIRKVAENGTAVLLVTHNVLEAERAMDRLAVINQARILAEGTPASLKASYRGQLRLRITLEPSVDTPPAPSWARQAQYVGRRLLLALDESDAITAIEWARSLVRDSVAEEYELAPPTLEDSYIQLIGNEDAQEGRGDHDRIY
jgi:ABC-2 type transport system ATP-binding protein